ncbi:MAG TPA: DUF4337 family protein, partial [Candidatus Udaeobacter sp.]|nr:DUF4337 family protein [Candidatus Udaeobacter sp.]
MKAAAKSNFHKHEVFARGVTMFQIAIAIAPISALTRRRKFWIVSLLFGGVGCVFLASRSWGVFWKRCSKTTRAEARDRLRAQNDYKVNLKAQLEIRHLHEKIDHLLRRQYNRLFEIQQIQ